MAKKSKVEDKKIDLTESVESLDVAVDPVRVESEKPKKADVNSIPRKLHKFL